MEGEVVGKGVSQEHILIHHLLVEKGVPTSPQLAFSVVKGHLLPATQQI